MKKFDSKIRFIFFILLFLSTLIVFAKLLSIPFSNLVHSPFFWMLTFLFFYVLYKIFSHPIFFQKFVPPATAEDIASIRILTCTILLISALWEDLISVSLLPLNLRVPMGLIDLIYNLPFVNRILNNPVGLASCKLITVVSLFLGIAGYRTRISLPVATFFYFLEAGIVRSHTFFYHTGLIPLYVIGILCFTPCADTLSFDRNLASKHHTKLYSISFSYAYSWGRYLCWMMIALPYLAAGLSKLRFGGIFWWNADNLRYWLYACNLYPMHFNWGIFERLVTAPDYIFTFIGLAAISGELLFILVLFSKKARLIFPCLMILMHIAILFLQNLLFLDLILIHLSFYNLSRLTMVGGKLHPLKYSSQSLKHINVRPPGSPYPFIASLLLGVIFFAWYGRIEYYPLSAIQMYSKNNLTSDLYYYKALAHYQSGTISEARFDRIIGALKDARYRKLLWDFFSTDKKRREKAIEFLNVCGKLMNSELPANNKIIKFEIQKWHWDFKKDAKNPNYGNMVENFIYSLTYP